MRCVDKHFVLAVSPMFLSMPLSCSMIFTGNSTPCNSASHGASFGCNSRYSFVRRVTLSRLLVYVLASNADTTVLCLAPVLYNETFQLRSQMQQAVESQRLVLTLLT